MCSGNLLGNKRCVCAIVFHTAGSCATTISQSVVVIALIECSIPILSRNEHPKGKYSVNAYAQGTLAQFLGYFQGNLARAINKELGRHGKFFSREYDDVIVSGEREFLNRYVYILCNAVKAGLVERAEQWPGWSSLQGAMQGAPYRFELLNATKYYKAKRFGKKVDRAEFVETWPHRSLRLICLCSPEVIDL